jgi:hypothetical protein
MSLGLCFWIIFLVLILFCGVLAFGGPYYGHYGVSGGSLVVLALLALLGWRVFGPPLHG